MRNRRVLAAALADGDHVARLDRERRDVDLAAVHGEVAMANELARRRARGCEPEPIRHVIQTPLEQLQQRFAGNAARAFRLLEVAAELILEHTVNALDLLLLAQLDAVADDLLLTRFPVLPWREVP